MSGLRQYPAIIGFNLPLNYPPGLRNYGDGYTGTRVLDQKRLALKDIRLFRGKLYGNGTEWNVRIRFTDVRKYMGDTTSTIAAYGE